MNDPCPKINSLEIEILQNALGLGTRGEVSRNTLTPRRGPESSLVLCLEAKGMMRGSLGTWYVTVLGLQALAKRRPIVLGKIG